MAGGWLPVGWRGGSGAASAPSVPPPSTQRPLQTATTPTGDLVLVDKSYDIRHRYDEFLVPAGAAIPRPIQFFQVPQGAAGSGFALKTVAHTNQIQRNQLEKGVAINVMGIEVSIYAVGTARQGDGTMTRIASLWADSLFRLRINDVLELEARGKHFASGSGMTGIPQMNGPAARTWVAPFPTIRGVRRLRRTIPIAAREMFTCELDFNPNNTYLAAGVIPEGEEFVIRCSLFGRMSRPIE